MAYERPRLKYSWRRLGSAQQPPENVWVHPTLKAPKCIGNPQPFLVGEWLGLSQAHVDLFISIARPIYDRMYLEDRVAMEVRPAKGDSVAVYLDAEGLEEEADIRVTPDRRASGNVVNKINAPGTPFHGMSIQKYLPRCMLRAASKKKWGGFFISIVLPRMVLPFAPGNAQLIIEREIFATLTGSRGQVIGGKAGKDIQKYMVYQLGRLAAGNRLEQEARATQAAIGVLPCHMGTASGYRANEGDEHKLLEEDAGHLQGDCDASKQEQQDVGGYQRPINDSPERNPSAKIAQLENEIAELRRQLGVRVTHLCDIQSSNRDHRYTEAPDKTDQSLDGNSTSALGNGHVESPGDGSCGHANAPGHDATASSNKRKWDVMHDDIRQLQNGLEGIRAMLTPLAEDFLARKTVRMEEGELYAKVKEEPGIW